MVDNGVGFDIDERHDLSYGLNNIEERVDDMAGTMTLLSQKEKEYQWIFACLWLREKTRRKKMAQKIRVILVDDHEMVRLGLKSFLTCNQMLKLLAKQEMELTELNLL